jgi:hypothetical protein
LIGRDRLDADADQILTSTWAASRLGQVLDSGQTSSRLTSVPPSPGVGVPEVVHDPATAPLTYSRPGLNRACPSSIRPAVVDRPDRPGGPRPGAAASPASLR